MRKNAKESPPSPISRDVTERTRVEAEMALKVSEMRYRRLFETACDGIFLLDAATGQITDANPFLVQLLGYSKEESLGKKLWEVGPFKDVEACKVAFKELQATNYIRYDNLPLQTKDGRGVAVEFVSNVYLVDGQKVIQCNIRDITERARAEERLQQALRQLAGQKQALDQFAIVAETDPQGRITYANDKFCEIAKYTRAELLGKDHRDVVNSGYHPKEFWKQMWATINSGKLWRGDVCNRTKDGELYWEDTTIVPFIGSDGKPEKYLAVRAVITERKEVEAQLRRLATIVIDSNDAITVQDFKGNIIAWNRGAERIYGYPEAEALKMNIRDTVPEEKWEEALAFAKKLQEEEEEVPSFETQRRTKDGRILDVWLTMTVLRDEAGKPIGVATTERDITERKRAEESLRAANEELRQLSAIKDDFISSVSHELRTPLAITREGISLVLDGVSGVINEKQQRVLTTAQLSIDRLARLVNELLDMSKLQAGKVRLIRSRVNLLHLAQQTAVLFEPRARAKGLTLTVHGDSSGVEVYGDIDRLTQVLMNLLDNAVKCTQQGMIEVSVRAQAHEVICVVADTGIGISQEDLPKVCGKFEQFACTGGNGEHGAGLGLAIVKGLVELHHGTIHVESELGKGTTFTLALPAYTAEAVFRESVSEAVAEAIKDGEPLSLVLISVDGAALRQPQRVREKGRVLHDELEGMLKDTLRRKGDRAIPTPAGVVLLLADCNHTGAVSAKGRVERLLNDYWAEHQMNALGTFAIGCATYPDDASTAEALIGRAAQDAGARTASASSAPTTAANGVVHTLVSAHGNPLGERGTSS